MSDFDDNVRQADQTYNDILINTENHIQERLNEIEMIDDPDIKEAMINSLNDYIEKEKMNRYQETVDFLKNQDAQKRMKNAIEYRKNIQTFLDEELQKRENFVKDIMRYLIPSRYTGKERERIEEYKMYIKKYVDKNKSIPYKISEEMEKYIPSKLHEKLYEITDFPEDEEDCGCY